MQAAAVDAGSALAATTHVSGLANIYSYTLGGGIVSYAPLHRCILLVSSTMATLVTKYSLVVVDDDERVVDNELTRAVLGLLKNSPDGALPSFTFFEDAARSYLLEGNALMQVQRLPGPRRRPIALRLLRQSDAATEMVNGEVVYKAAYYHNSDGQFYTFSANDVAHARWPLSGPISWGRSPRSGFAQPPVVAIRQNTAIGMAADQYVLSHFQYPGSHVSVEFPYDAHITPDQARRVSKMIDELRRTGYPSVVPEGGKIQRTADADMASKIELRKYEQSEVGSYYGVPNIFLVSDQSQWGSGIENYIKIFNFEVMNHLSRLLDAVSHTILPAGLHLRTDSLASTAHSLEDIGRLLQRDRARGGSGADVHGPGVPAHDGLP